MRLLPRPTVALAHVAAIVLACLLPACTPSSRQPSPPPVADGIDGGRALAEAREFAGLGSRDAGTAGAEAAAAYLVRRLRETGLEPVVDEFTDNTPDGPQTFRNVLVLPWETGPKLVIVTSHYDTKTGIPGFVGANDSASSTGLLLELARGLAASPPPGVTLMLAFLDGEECRRSYGPSDGLHGSRRLADKVRTNNRSAAVLGVIVIDMVGDRDLHIALPRNGSSRLISLAFRCAEEANVRSRFGLAPGNVLDDHVPFLDAGLPAVDLIDFDYGSAPGRNDYWHTAEDTVDKISAESLQTVGNVVARMVRALASDPVAPRR